jgi:hypothetical protein
LDGVVQGEPGDRQGTGAGQIRKPHRGRRELAVEHRTSAHFRPIVILGINPEHRHDRDAMFLRYLRRQLHRGDGFQQGEQRAPEQTSLLTGDDHPGRGVGQAGRGLTRRRRGAAFGLLRRNQPGNFDRLPSESLRALDCVGPRGWGCGIAGKERRHLLKIERIIRRQAPNPRECPDVHRQRSGGSGRNVGWHCDVLSQTVTNTVNLGGNILNGNHARCGLGPLLGSGPETLVERRCQLGQRS